MKDKKIYGYAQAYSLVMLLLMAAFSLRVIFRGRYSFTYNTVVEMGLVNTFTALLCTMGLNATDYALIWSSESSFPHGIDVGDLGLILFGLCALLIALHVISMIKMINCRKIAFRVPLLLNTLDLACHLMYLAGSVTAIFALILKLVGEIVLLIAHITQKKEIKRIKKEAKEAARQMAEG